MKIKKTLTGVFLVLMSSVVSGDPGWPNLKEIIIATKCHIDVGYTATVPALERQYRTRDLTRAFALFDGDKDKPVDLRARWTLSTWAMDVIMTGNYLPERRMKLEDAVRQRHLTWHAYPYTIQTEASDLEEMVRMFADGSDMARAYGFDLPRYVKATDVPDFAWATPTVLAHAGVKFLHMGLNPGCKQTSLLKDVPPMSWWQGPDGSRVLLGFSDGYGWPGWGSVIPPKGWKHKTWLAFLMLSDNRGPMPRARIDRQIDAARKLLPGVRIRFGDPAEFAEAIIAEEKNNPTLPVVRGDMPDTWIHGLMTAPEATILHRRVMGELITLGVLNETLRAYGVATDPVANALAYAYRKSCLYSEHTWGLACYLDRRRFHAPDWRERYERGDFWDIDAAFDYHMQYARDAHKTADDAISERMRSLARNVALEGPRVTVFNPLPWKRDAVVSVKMPQNLTVPGGVRRKEYVTFLAKDLPAGGYKTFRATANAGEADSTESLDGEVVKTRHFTVRFDLAKGGIVSLIENATGRELVRKGGYALGQFLHERFSMNEVDRFVSAYNRAHQRGQNSDFGKCGMPGPEKISYAAMTPGKWKATITQNSLGKEIRLVPEDTLGLAEGYELRFDFPDASAYVDISWTVKGKKADPTPEGGWICLPFNVAKPVFRVGRIGASADPAKDFIFGSNRNLMAADRAITVRSGASGAGVAVASADLPLWSLGKPGLWRYEPDYVPTEPDVYVNLYNNQWNTNFPFWIPGSWTASLRLYPVPEGADEERAVFTPAWEMRQPCAAAFADGKGGALAAEERGVEVSRKGVRVTAYCPNPDGFGTVLRVWEQSGVGGEVTVSLPPGCKAKRARPVNLRGESAGEAVAVKDGKLTFALGAWAPKSFVLDGEAAAYRHYRFAVEATDGDALQLSEFKLFSGIRDITADRTRITYAEGTFNPAFKDGFSPLKAVDGDLGSKWYDDRFTQAKKSSAGKDVWLTLEYDRPVVVTRYELYTADDASKYPGRNPAAWRLQGSEDGKSWTDLDVVRGATVSPFDGKMAYSRRLDIPKALPRNLRVYPMAASGGKRPISYNVNLTTVRELVPEKQLHPPFRYEKTDCSEKNISF